MSDTKQAKTYATPQQYQLLLSLLERNGTMPIDYAAVCRLKYDRKFYTLSREHADDLIHELGELGPYQNRVRQWIATTTDLLAGQWVKGDLDA